MGVELESRLSSSDRRETTDLLAAWASGDRRAEELLFERIYPELKRLAASHLRRAGSELTLDPAELTHEAYLKLVDQKNVSWRNRAHFFAIAARLIRRILLNYARNRNRQKRGGGWTRIRLEAVDRRRMEDGVDLVRLCDALDRLNEIDPKALKIVELRYFAGLTVDEVAEVTGVSSSTIAREWRSARVWLKAHLHSHGETGTGESKA